MKTLKELWQFVKDVWAAMWWESADMDEEWLVDDFDESYFEYEDEEDEPEEI